MLLLHRNESQPGVTSDYVEGHSPICPALDHGSSHRIVVARLHGVAMRFGAAKHAIDKEPCTASLISINHHARGIANCGCDGINCGPAFESGVAAAKHNALQATVS